MTKFSDRNYLRHDQYKDSSNLQARIDLHNRFSINPQGFMSWLFDRLDLPAASSILELGCGSGLLWSMNRDRIPHSWDITLSDLSDGMVLDARRNLASVDARFSLLAADTQAIPFPGETFDAVITNFVLHHVPDRPRAYAEINRVLKPGGRCYAAAFGRAHMVEMDDLVRQVAPGARSWTPPFSLENGQEEFSSVFAEVTLQRYEDALNVTEAEPLVAYILSGQSRARVAGKEEALRTVIEEELARKGSINIGKDSGLFIAHKG